MPKNRRPSLAEIAAELKGAADAEPRDDEEPPTPGWFTEAGQLIHLDGTPLTRERKITPKEAAVLVVAGADVAFEGCGCGGYVGCQPWWCDEEELAALKLVGKPRIINRSGSDTWIDLWTGNSRNVVLLNGDVKWDRIIPFS